jgi:hypothetical protein
VSGVGPPPARSSAARRGGDTAVTPAAPPGRIGLPALLIIGAGLGVTALTLGAIYFVQQQDLHEADARRARLHRRVVDQRRDQGPAAGAAAPATPAAGVAPAAGAAPAAAGGCPQGTRAVAGGAPFCIDIYEYPGGRTLPRVSVTWREAKAVCEGRGARLCSASEWERACRGPNGALYPYGARFDAARCNVARNGKPGELRESGARPGCRSAAGIFDMSGNAAEWIDEPAYRGGSVEGGAAETTCTTQVASTPDGSGPSVGFRCCATPTGALAAPGPEGR